MQNNSDLRPWGYANGQYKIKCMDCPVETPWATGAKRSFRCAHHAEIAQLKYYHDKRVTALIRANSINVIRRRVLNVKLKAAHTAVLEGAKQFRDYACQHRRKNTVEADIKARTNDMMADKLEQAFLINPNPDDYGRE